MLEIAVATIATFALGGAYYGVLGSRLDSDAAMAPWKVGVELARCLVLVAVVAGLATEAGVDDVAGGLALGAALFAGFPLVLWTGAIIHEGTSPRLAVIHGGDWLVKLLVIGTIVSLGL